MLSRYALSPISKSRYTSLKASEILSRPLRKFSTGSHELRRRRWPKERAFGTKGIQSTSDSKDSLIRVSQLLGILLVLGIGATTWGLYEFYSTLTMWPKEVRDDLRAGLKAKHRGDMKLARKHLTKAWQTLQTLSPESLSPDPYLKYSGVAVSLAEVLEGEQDLDEAFTVLKAALVAFVDKKNTPPTNTSKSDKKSDATVPLSGLSTSPPDFNSNASRPPYSSPRFSLLALLDSGSSTVKSQLNSKARMRATAIALKLGDLAETLRRPEEEEYCLGFAVTEVLRLIRDEYGLAHDPRRGFQPTSGSKGISDAPTGSKMFDKNSSGLDDEANHEREKNDNVRHILSPDSTDDELELPAWVSLTKTELAAPMERLGAFYARQGKYGNAITLYRVASSLLVRAKPISPNSKISQPSVSELCQALQIENAHMALMMDLRRAHPEDETIQRDLPRIFSRAVHLYDEAVQKHGSKSARDEGPGTGSEISLCDEAYPAVLYNAGIYYEEEGQLEQALRSYILSSQALRAHGNREMMYEALENARRIRRIIKNNQVDETPSSNETSSGPANEPFETPAQK